MASERIVSPSPVHGRALILVGAWAAAVALGFGVLLRYDNRPGEAGDAPFRWPTETALTRGAEGATVFVFVHPHCPCTKATAAVLEKAAARLEGRLRGLAVLCVPPGQGADWAATDLAERLGRIPGFTTVLDPHAREAGRFGAETSGHVVAFSAGGDLLFAGGVTGARGHEGDNAGADAFVEALRTGRPATIRPPTFGCPLSDRGCTEACRR